MVGNLTIEREVARNLDLAPLGPEARRQVILMLSAEYPVRLICQATGWPRSSDYHHAAPAVDEGRLRREGWSGYGRRVRRLMAEMDLKGKVRVRRRRTTDSRHDFPRYPNLVERLEVTHRDQVWLADITDVLLREEFVYLAVVMDVSTRRVRGWELGRNLDQGLTLAAPRRAMRWGRRSEGHHSDQRV